MRRIYEYSICGERTREIQRERERERERERVGGLLLVKCKHLVP